MTKYIRRRTPEEKGATKMLCRNHSNLFNLSIPSLEPTFLLLHFITNTTRVHINLSALLS